MSKIAIILTPGFADWEYGMIAGTGGPFYGFNVQYFAPEAGEVPSQGGLVAVVQKELGELSKWHPDVVVVVGGQGWETAEAADVSGLLRDQHDRGATVAGICGGTLALARSGLLNNRRHTSNDADFLSRNAASYAGADHYVSSPSAVSEDRVITAPGTAPASFAAAVFEAAGLDQAAVGQFKGMLAAEHA